MMRRLINADGASGGRPVPGLSQTPLIAADRALPLAAGSTIIHWWAGPQNFKDKASKPLNSRREHLSMEGQPTQAV